MSGGRKAAVSGSEEAEVDALLRAAQDAVLLKLQANSHLVSSTSASASNPPSLDAAAAAPDPLDADLARRFDALKSRAPPPTKPAGDGAGSGGLEARFAALKGAAGPEKETRVRLEDLGWESEDEVDKVMRWALDAARLDVATAGVGGGDKAKPAEEEDDKDEKSSLSSEEDDDDDERLQLELARKRKEKMGKSKSKNRWFF
ncbi:uncharacterized protein LOC133895369 [Phragmites australis]|uniref:uncharacterized protein LOC133895369 n=1 Tax=Phragmites australis TaxID=29695 RepID=UPI002D78EE95|nr:uncharacterized protein LOC133895369 [Phragmites australis]